jgi:Ca-activated chloride channel homolog
MGMETRRKAKGTMESVGSRCHGHVAAIGACIGALLLAGCGASESGAMANSGGYSGNPSGSGTVGLAAGGAKDANNFRENIANNYLPLVTDITYEGVFYDYYFDTGATGPCDALFCPSYVPMLSTDPTSGTQEPFLSVGLNSGIKESDFARKQLNLVVVLDVSGSMGEAFNSYYYDQNGNQVQSTEDAGKTKIAIATESIVAMMGHLQAGDRLGVVTFTDSASTLKALSSVGETDMNALARQILALTEQGGTNLEAGYKLGTDMLAKLGTVDPQVYESRIILLTDAMPNMGDTSASSLSGMVASNAGKRIFTTFIGVGVDFNSSLIEILTKTKGANYYSVHGSQEFKQRMDTEFDYMVTPLVFDLRLSLKTDGFAVKDVYGSPRPTRPRGSSSSSTPSSPPRPRTARPRAASSWCCSSPRARAARSSSARPTKTAMASRPAPRSPLTTPLRPTSHPTPACARPCCSPATSG